MLKLYGGLMDRPVRRNHLLKFPMGRESAGSSVAASRHESAQFMFYFLPRLRCSDAPGLRLWDAEVPALRVSGALMLLRG